MRASEGGCSFQRKKRRFACSSLEQSSSCNFCNLSAILGAAAARPAATFLTRRDSSAAAAAPAVRQTDRGAVEKFYRRKFHSGRGEEKRCH